MYVERLALSEFRAIARSDIEFTHPMSPGADRKDLPNINLLVGTNGGGKSTILKGIAAAALGDLVDLERLTGDAIGGWPRIGATGSCVARLTYRALEGVSDADSGSPGSVSEGVLSIGPRGVGHSRTGGTASAAEHLDVNLFGYGPQRFVGDTLDPESASDPTSRVANLFEQRHDLFAPEPWVPEVGEATLAAINALMPPDTRLTGNLQGDQLEVENRGLKVARFLLSDGAQSYMAWILDLIFRLYEAGGSEDFWRVTGTVLVDEVDQRMHPQWQQVVLQRLAVGLPNLQFICSAHSPLLAGGLRPENLIVLEPDFDASGDGAMKASRYEEDIYGRTADGVLTSSYFNLASSRSEQFRQDLRLLADAAATMDRAAIDFIRTLAAGSSDEDIRVRSEIVPRPDRLRRRRQ